MILPKPLILIIHESRQAATYASLLEKTGAKVHAVTSFDEANELLSFLHPDLVLLAANMPQGDGRLYCQQIRATLVHPRPVLVLMHSGDDVNERIKSFRYGADDVLADPIDKNELAIRVLAHLRRRQEELSSRLTQLPAATLSRRMLEQSLVSDRPWAALSVDINSLRIYNEVYGDLAGDQLIKALGAILVESAAENDFVGHIEADDFLLITDAASADEKAEKICQQFDKASKRFYPSEDIERGYLVATGIGGIRRRLPLISIAIGIVNSTTRRFQSYVDVLTNAHDVRSLAKQKPGSGWVSDGIMEPGVYCKDPLRSRILVVEPDGAMACLLQENLSLEGYVVEVASSAAEALDLCRHEPQPDLVLLESTLADRGIDGWEFCRMLKCDDHLGNIWVIMATAHPDQVRALEAGADLYLPKPFDIPSLLQEVNSLLRSRLYRVGRAS
jgi:DNA-binding response OmpR family regulator